MWKKTLKPFSSSTGQRKIQNHNCRLTNVQSEHILVDIIYTGVFVNFRRKFRQQLTVSDSNPESKLFFKSTAQICQERRRHMVHYYYMIHPFSNFRTIWESVMIIVYLMLILFVIPSELCFLIRTPTIIMYPKLFLDLICCIDIVINFFTGYIDKGTQKIELNFKTVVKRYLFGNYHITGLFAVDLIPSLPVTFIIYMTESYDQYPWKIIFGLKLFRVKTLITYINNYFVRRKFWSYRLKPVLLTIWVTIFVFWCTSFTVFLLTLSFNEEFSFDWGWEKLTDYLIDISTRIVECVMLVGPDSINTKDDDNSWQRNLLNIFLIVLGSVINMVILAQVLRIYKSRNAAKNKHQKLLQEIGQYTTYKEIPPDLRDKMINFVDFKYHRRILREAEIMNSLSEILRDELMLNNCQNLVERVDFFKDLPPALLMKIVTKLRPEVYLKNEVIFHIGATATAMYFIYVGIVGIYSCFGKEMMQLGEGKHIGEVSLINNLPRVYSAVAKSDSELLRLNKKDLSEVLKPYPRVEAKLTALGLEKQKHLESMVKRKSTLVTAESNTVAPL